MRCATSGELRKLMTSAGQPRVLGLVLTLCERLWGQQMVGADLAEETGRRHGRRVGWEERGVRGQPHSKMLCDAARCLATIRKAWASSAVRDSFGKPAAVTAPPRIVHGCAAAP